MLTQTLRALEANGLVARYDFQTVPPHVEYELTLLGQSLAVTVRHIDEWVRGNYLAVADARAAFITRQAAA